MKAIIYNAAVLGFANTATFAGNQVNTDGASYGGLDPTKVQIIDATEPADFMPGLYTYVGNIFVRGIDAPEMLSAAKQAQISAINAGCQSSLNMITASYPPSEMITWPQQLLEAVSYTANNTAVTPMLSAIATAGNTTVAALAASVLNKAAAYQLLSGSAIGRRQALTAQIMAATTVPAVKNIIW